MSGVVCMKLSLSKSLALLEYEFFKQCEEREKEVNYVWKAKIHH